MADIADGQSVEVKGSAAKPYVLTNKGGVYSCTCPAWRNQPIAIEQRTCKHLRGVRGDDAEAVRVGASAPPPKPKKQKAASTASTPSNPEASGGKEPPLLLAHVWENEQDLTDWWMSEKLDGVRAYWDGTSFISRLGNPYLAPDWFVQGLPPVPLDGELWSGRKRFQRTISIVRRQDRSDDWKEVTFVVFDAPALAVAFEDRLEFCRTRLAETQPSYARVHPHDRCKGIDHLKSELARVESLGGEGLMLRKPGSLYEAGRSTTLLKVKSFRDAEARVLEHLPGAGKHEGKLGALLVELQDGTRFSVGTGFSDAERKDPPPPGSIITFRYQELSEGGVPRFPSYVGVRHDVAWKSVQTPTAASPKKATAPAPVLAVAQAAMTQPAKTPEPEMAGSFDERASTGKAWKFGDKAAPAFPSDFDIVHKAVLQLTDLVSNHNKYYAIEIHRAATGTFRVFTHYGRTDDLETNPDAGAKECRFFSSLSEAEGAYRSIASQKTRKGYREVSLASSRIGSQKARGTSSGDVDQKTLAKIAKPPSESVTPAAPSPAPPLVLAAPPPPTPPPASIGGKLLSFAKRLTGLGESATPPPMFEASTPASAMSSATPVYTGSLSPQLYELVRYIYAEATTALTTTVAAKITANGIETPLGVLTIGQIEKGEALLHELYSLFQKKSASRAEMVRLSGEFYTVIPHRLGRTRTAVEEAVIDSMEDFEQKQETLQLMKDMLAVNGEGGDVLFKSEVEKQYEALRCEMAWVDPASTEGKEIASSVLKSQVKSRNIRVVNIFTLRRDTEWHAFTTGIDNQRLLFHGSRIKNWVGILSRGILMPKIAVSMGVHRTDPGWLGNGIYFGDAACTSAYYTTAGRRKTRLMAITRVALGRIKDFTKITYGLTRPPPGFDSCHGVRARPGVSSQFADDEYVVYKPQQQRLEMLIEFTA